MHPSGEKNHSDGTYSLMDSELAIATEESALADIVESSAKISP